MDHSSIGPVLDKALSGQRLDLSDLRLLLETGDWPELVACAREVRRRRLGRDAASYTAFRVINYTNHCNVDCSFCSFKDDVGSHRGYTLSLEEIEVKTREAKELGCDAIFLQGGVNPELPLSYYTQALELVSRKYGMHVRGFSPVELQRLSEKEGIALPDLLQILKSAGLGSVPGAGAEILSDHMRQVLSPRKLSGAQWCEVMGECHKAGLPGTCNIVFGSCETTDDVVEHFRLLRDQQDRTGGFLAFVAWVFQAQTKGFPIRHVKSWEYLRMVAAARLFFDNIDHLEVSVMVMGRELAELALEAGADDISSVVIEENVLASRGLKTIRAVERFLAEAGYRPRRRTLGYDYLD